MKLYSIGQFAKICNVTTELLRYYDRIGIISPSTREENNYRYYAESQIEDVFLVKQLKHTGLSLESISEIVRNKDIQLIKNTLQSKLRMQRQLIDDQLKNYDALVETLIELDDAIMLINGNKMHEYTDEQVDFKIISIAERPIFSIRKIGELDPNQTLIFRYTELLNKIEKEKVDCSRTVFLAFHDHWDRQYGMDKEHIGDLEVFCNISGSKPDSPNCRLFGGFLAATTTFVGHYRNMKDTYEKLASWAEHIGYSVYGISFQEMVVSRLLTNNENDFVTKLYLPLNTKTF